METKTTDIPMIKLFLNPLIILASFTKTPNHSVEKQSQGERRGKPALLKAVMLITISGPKRYAKNRKI
jgi:hypothetical protein|tara:strand:+ start:157 stop:360 length:204 start_codon:yes stop_codon:yes gene_type:complete